VSRKLINADEPSGRRDAKEIQTRRFFATDENQMHTDEDKLIQLFCVRAKGSTIFKPPQPEF
jgi:hypothetical protein